MLDEKRSYEILHQQKGKESKERGGGEKGNAQVDYPKLYSSYHVFR